MAYKLSIKEADPANYGAMRNPSAIKYLVYHYTGNHGDTARNNASYFALNKVKTSAHYFVDDSEIWQSVPDTIVAWAVGGTKYAASEGGSLYQVVTNSNSISIEMCGTGSGLEASELTKANAIELGKKLMAKYKIPLDHVVRHYDVTGKQCPAYLVNDSAWAAFKARLVENEIDLAVDWAKAVGILKGDTSGDLALNAAPTRRQLAVMLYRFYNLIK